MVFGVGTAHVFSAAVFDTVGAGTDSGDRVAMLLQEKEEMPEAARRGTSATKEAD